MSSTGLQSLHSQGRRLLQAMWRRRWVGVGVAWLVALVAAPVVMVMPNRYEASAQVYVDTQTVLKPLMQGLAYTPDIDQQVRMLARTLISRPNVQRLVESPDLGLAIGKGPAERERLTATLMNQIKVASVPGTSNLYAIRYRDTDPVRARQIVDGTIGLFVNAGSETKKRDSEEASQFIDEQIKLYEAKLIEAENRLKDFKIRNFGSSGVASQDFFTRMSTLVDEVGRLKIELASAQQAREAYKRELASESPLLPPESLPGAPPVIVSEVDARLESQKKLLDEMLRRYTDAHPDVVATRRVIAQLEAQKREEERARAAAAASGKIQAAAATSPVYQKIRISLAETEALVASLRTQLAQKEAQLAQIRAAAGRMPQIEADLAQLNRDYDIIHKNYQALVARRESASLGVRMDEGSRLAEFRIVEPPRVTPKPVFPGRLHLALIAIAAAIAAGLATPIALDLLFPTFKDAASLRKATGREVLGSISMNFTEETRRAMRGQGFRVAFACFGLLVLQSGWLAWLVGHSAVN